MLMDKINKLFLTLILILCNLVLVGCSSNTLQSISIIKVPDIKGGPIHKGFTCTGLTYDTNEDIFYIGNIGKELPTSEGFQSTIVKVSKDFMTNLGEIDLYTMFPSMDDI